MGFNSNKFKERALTIDSMGLLYILVVGGLCHILPIPEIVKGFLALPGFLIIPYLVGNIFAPKRTTENNKGVYKKISVFILAWMLGLIVLTIGAMILELLNIFNIFYYVILVFIIIGIKLLYLAYAGKCSDTHENITISNYVMKYYKDATIISIIILLPLTLLMGISPFPTNSTGDTFRFSLGTHQIINHSLIPYASAYFPFLEIIISIISLIFNMHSFTLFWTGIFFSYFVYGFGIYLLGYRLSNNKVLPLLMVLFAIFPFWSKTINLYRFIPQAWIHFVFPYALFVIHSILHQSANKIKTKNLIKVGFVSLIILFMSYKCGTQFLPASNYFPIIKILYFIGFWIFTIILLRLIFNTNAAISISTIFAFLTMIHHPMSFLAITLLIIYLILYFLSKYNISYYYFISYTLILGIIIAIIFHIPEHISSTGTLDIFYYNLGFLEKVDLLTYIFSYFTISLFIIGVLYIILRRFRDVLLLSFLVVSLSALFIYLMDMQILIRMLPLFGVFGVFIISHGFLFVIDQVGRASGKKYRYIIVQLLFIIMLLCVLNPILNYINDARAVGAEDSISSFDQEEYHAALWIEKNVPNAVIISDPWTQLIISGLSGTQNIGELFSGSRMRKVLKGIITSQKEKETYDFIILILSQSQNIYIDYSKIDYSRIKKEDLFQRVEIAIIRMNRFESNLTKKDPLIVITPRTIKYGNYNYLWFPAETKSYIWGDMFPAHPPLDRNSPEIKKFFNSTYFELIYNDENKIYIFKLKNQTEQNESAKY